MNNYEPSIAYIVYASDNRFDSLEDGAKLNLSDKDQKWLELNNIFEF